MRARGSGMLRAVDLVVQVVDRVIVDPVRGGRLRSAGWPPGLAGIVWACLALYGALALVTLTGPWVRQALPAGSSAFGISPDLLPAALFAGALLAAVLVTAAQHAPWPVRLAGLAAPLLLWSSMAQLATALDQLIWSALGLLALVAFHLIRSASAFAWWEFVVNLVVIGAVTAANLAGFVRPAMDAGAGDASFVTVTVVMSIGVFGLGYAVISGAATAEVAFGSSAWFVEYLGRSATRRTQAVVVATIAGLAWFAVGWRVVRSPLPPWLYAAEVLIAVGVLAVTGAGWLALDAAMDRREARAGLPRDDTDVAELWDAFRGLAVPTGLALALPYAANMIWANLERGLRLPLNAVGVQYVPGDLVNRLVPGTDGARLLLLAGDGLAVVVCLVVAVRAFGRRRRGPAELALVIGLFCLAGMLERIGVPLVVHDLETLAGAMVLITTAVGGYWLVRGRLTVHRGQAIGVALLLGAAVSGRDLLADPIGWLLGGSGGFLLVLGLVWNLLTGAEHANGDSASFPRPSRALLSVGYLTLAMLIAASDAVAVTFAVDLDRFVRLGVEVIGTGLLVTGLWAVLSTAGRNRPTVEPAGPPSPPWPG